MPFLVILLMAYGVFLIVRPFNTLFHELGHAIPAILLSKQKVTVYIGSYGDTGKSSMFKFGLLELWVNFNPFSWSYGLCAPSKTMSINQQIIYIFCGPLASTLVASTACYFTFFYDLHGAIKLVVIAFLGLSLYDLVRNLTPLNAPLVLFNGKITYNDGEQLRRLFRYKKLPVSLDTAIKHFDDGEYHIASDTFKEILASVEDLNVYRLAASSYLHAKRYQEFLELHERFSLVFVLNADDYSDAGVAYTNLNLHQKALETYNEALKLDACHKYALNNKGFSLNELGMFNDAISVLDRAIEADKDFAYAYNNRGFAKIKSGQQEDGHADIQHAIKLDPDNSYGYRNLGIYHLDRDEYKDALPLFKKAREMDSSTHTIDELIVECETRL